MKRRSAFQKQATRLWDKHWEIVFAIVFAFLVGKFIVPRFF